MIAARFSLPLFPEQASTLAPRVDALLFFLLGVSTFFTLLIAGCLVVFAIRYRRRPGNEVAEQVHGSDRLEIAWSVIPLLLFCFHYDPATGKYGALVMGAVRAGGALTLVALGAFLALAWRREARRP